MRAFTALVAALALTACGTASAQSTFRISQLFSNLDGSIQYIELVESAGLDGQQHFQGLVITVTHEGRTDRFVFNADLPTDKTANVAITVAATPLLLPGPTIFEVGPHASRAGHPNYLMPARFLATEGGVVDFAGFDRLEYAALPIDGTTALYRDGTIARATMHSGCQLMPNAVCPTQIQPTATRVEAVEYYNPSLDHYFVSASAADIDALDSGRLRGWRRTGESLWVGETALTAQDLEYHYEGSPVCRFYIPVALGDSHFFSASADECAAVRAKFPDFIEESPAAFYAALPAPSGECGVMVGVVDGDIPLQPVYRLWNQRADSNHRYVTNVALRDAMIQLGWLPEGAGPLGVAFCI